MFWCPECNYTTKDFPPDFDSSGLIFRGEKPKPVDPRFGRLLSGEGWAVIGDKRFPLYNIRIVKYNPDGDPADSYELNKKPNITDGEE